MSEQDNKPTSPGVVSSDHPTLDVDLNKPDETKEPVEPSDSQEQVEQEDEAPAQSLSKPVVTINTQVTMTKNPVEKLDVQASTTVALPNLTATEINDLTEEQQRLIVQAQAPKEGNSYQDVLYNVLPHLIFGDVFTASQNLEGADWQQTVEFEGKTFRTSKPKYQDLSDGGKVSGERALVELDKAFGIGGQITLPLINSGIWITLDTVTNIDFITYDERIRLAKNEFGKRTLGMIYSNSRVYIINNLMTLIEEHVSDCSVEGWEDVGLRNLIKLTDLEDLAAGLAYTLYPNGFQYMSPCTAPPKGSKHCDYTLDARLQIADCFWYNRRALSRKQKAFMADRHTRRTVKEVREYQEEFEVKQNAFKVEDKLEIYFKVPTIGENITSGYDWIESIESLVTETFGGAIDNDQVNEFIDKRLSASILRQYGHFFKTIKFVDSGTHVEDTKDLETIITRLSTRTDVVDKIIEHIGKFIDTNTHSLIAVPRYHCPKCQGEQQQDIEKHPYLIPIEVISLFFTLGNQKTLFGSLT